MDKKTPDEWLKEPRFAGITVLDPDGWDRSNFAESWAEEITEGEMNRRIIMSTCLIASQDVQKDAVDAIQKVMNGVACPNMKGI